MSKTLVAILILKCIFFCLMSIVAYIDRGFMYDRFLFAAIYEMIYAFIFIYYFKTKRILWSLLSIIGLTLFSYYLFKNGYIVLFDLVLFFAIITVNYYGNIRNTNSA